ncbi:uncharacterized protein LOC135680735 [Rhopilema esculentum]|uniref:uncharacterized protein LOC135680735 n=1 Tax=Rhopilema esculentum TaxID=499914 RepID=UPI0031E2C78B
MILHLYACPFIICILFKAQTKTQCIYECKTNSYKYAFVDQNHFGCYCGNIEPSRKGFDMVHPRFCSSPPLYRHCTVGICLRGGFGKLYLTVPDAFNTTTPAKKVSSGNLSAELIGSSFGIMAFLVLTFIFIRYRIKKRQRAERSNRGANQYLPVQTPDVCYAPDSALGDASPSYSDATKEGVVFMDSRNAVALCQWKRHQGLKLIETKPRY